MATNLSCLDPNLSRTDLTEEYWTLDDNQDARTGVAIISAILFIFTVAGLLLNGAVLVGLTYKKFWRIPSTFLLFNLALVDFLTCAFIMPFMVVPGLNGGHYNFGNSDYRRCQACQAGVIIVIWLLYASMHIVAIMSLDRLIYIKKPMQYEKLITVPRLAIVLSTIWIFCLILCIPPLFGFGVIGYSKIVGTCSTLFSSRTRVGPGYLYIAFLVIEVMIPIGIIVVTNIWLLCYVRKGIKSRFENTHCKGESKISEVNTQAKKKYIAQQIRMVKVFGSIFASNFATWAPVLIVFIAIGAVGLENVPPGAFGVVFLCFLIQSVVHPLLESLLSAKIRKMAKKIFCGCCKHKKAGVTTKMSNLSNSGIHSTGNLELSIKKN